MMDADDLDDFLRSKQGDVYAPNWDKGKEKDLRRRLKMGSVAFLFFSVFVPLLVRALYKTAELGNKLENIPSSIEFEWEEKRKKDIFGVLGGVSGPLVNKSFTAQSTAASWIIADDPFMLAPESPYLVQRYIMALLYFSMGGSQWTIDGWLDGNEGECNWKKVTCDNNAKITALDFDNLNVRGRLPEELAFLPQLSRINFQKNHITGEVPSKWGDMISLEYLYLQQNNILGSIPKSICNLHQKSLLFLNVDCDTYPTQITCSCCTNCVAKEISKNPNPMIISDLRQKLASVTAVNQFSDHDTPQFKALHWLADEDLTAIKSTKLFLVQRYLVVLLYFSLDGDNWSLKNWLAGDESECTFPGVSCEAGIITTISLVSSGLKGTIPSEISKLTNLEILDFRDNHLTGTIPPQISNLQSLEALFLQHNDLVGTAPDSICQLRSHSLGSYLTDCIENKIVCSCCSNCASIEDINREAAVQTKIAVFTPTKFCQKALSWILREDHLHVEAENPNLIQRYALASIYFALDGGNWKDNNWLSEKSECEWTGISCNDKFNFITNIFLASSNLKGEIPDELSLFDFVTHIDMTDNELSGSIPTWFSSLYFLESLHLYGNNFSGEEPNGLCASGKLKDLRLDCDFFCNCCTECGPDHI